MTATKQTEGRTLVGTVISDKMDKTITVLVDRRVKHAKYGKYIRRVSKIKAHDENNVGKSGNQVLIKECVPLSKQKSWTLVEVLEA
ncbi:MAG: 30S ribosomal protein S17 [Legionellales bacterium]|nr:30S ribosomal protein S17 [Legionellales bacterium]